MQAAMQVPICHSAAVCSGSGRPAAQYVIPPVASAHVLRWDQRMSTSCHLRNSSCTQLLWQPSRVQGRRQASLQVRGSMNYGAEWSESPESYIVLGLAHCFRKDDNGKLMDHFVIEPISANSLECMAAGGKTCFKEVVSLKLGSALAKDTSDLPAEWAGAAWCENYEFRAGACARTWARQHAQDNLMDIVPLGQAKGKWNYNLDEKRVLNFENVVNDDDNIKQDLSIDVYGRAKEEEDEAAAAAAAEPEAQKVEEEELDSLLAA